MSSKQSNSQDDSTQKPPLYIKTIFGGLAGMGATAILHPMDIVKIRMQLQNESRIIHIIKNTVRNEGYKALYLAFSAGLLRQATYTTTRLALYDIFYEEYKRRNFGEPPRFITMTLLGATAGCIGAFIGVPAEVAMVRMTADGMKDQSKRMNYKHCFHALACIARSEGFFKLWRGSVPTMTRAIVVNAAQLSTYSKVQESTADYLQEGFIMQLTAALVSGLVTTAISMPVDIIKTSVQNAKQGSQVSIVLKLFREHGVWAFWRGFLPYYLRIGPHTMITFILLEQLKNFYSATS